MTPRSFAVCRFEADVAIPAKGAFFAVTRTADE